ncbi:high-affinity iron ion transporter FtrA [Aspergillus carlsbadensis]|nr:high-affinity iron ion transporter FtrA [Aspergillus carlsbadensis]
MTKDIFAVPAFFIYFRECVETGIIISVLLAFIQQTLSTEDGPTRKKLVKQVWWGVGLGLAICLCMGCGMIGAFYSYGKDSFSKAEDLWEGIFSLTGSIIITIMGAALLRVSKLKERWSSKLRHALEASADSQAPAKSFLKRWPQKYAMFLIPFVTALREGLEAVVFIGGVGLNFPACAIPLPVVVGIAAGVVVSYIMYRLMTAEEETRGALQLFLVVSTCLLYLVAAGLLSRGVWSLENNTWNHLIGGDASETGSGPGSYDIRQSVWHVNCCSPSLNGGGGWGVFNTIGWTNSATYGSVISYNLYWLAITLWIVTMEYKEHGMVPLATSATDVRRFLPRSIVEAPPFRSFSPPLTRLNCVSWILWVIFSPFNPTMGALIYSNSSTQQ